MCRYFAEYQAEKEQGAAKKSPEQHLAIVTSDICELYQLTNQELCFVVVQKTTMHPL